MLININLHVNSPEWLGKPDIIEVHSHQPRFTNLQTFRPPICYPHEGSQTYVVVMGNIELVPESCVL